MVNSGNCALVGRSSPAALVNEATNIKLHTMTIVWIDFICITLTVKNIVEGARYQLALMRPHATFTQQECLRMMYRKRTMTKVEYTETLRTARQDLT